MTAGFTAISRSGAPSATRASGPPPGRPRRSGAGRQDFATGGLLRSWRSRRGRYWRWNSGEPEQQRGQDVELALEPVLGCSLRYVAAHVVDAAPEGRHRERAGRSPAKTRPDEQVLPDLGVLAHVLEERAARPSSRRAGGRAAGRRRTASARRARPCPSSRRPRRCSRSGPRSRRRAGPCRRGGSSTAPGSLTSAPVTRRALDDELEGRLGLREHDSASRRSRRAAGSPS